MADSKNVLLLSLSQMESTLCFLDGIFREHLPSAKTLKLSLGTRSGTFSERYPSSVVDATAQLVREQCIDFLFVSLIEYGLARSLDFLSRIKARIPDIIVVGGGPYAIEYPETCITHPCIDVITYTHGLHSWRIVAEYPSLTAVPNIIYKIGRGTVRNPPADVHYEMDDVPLPDWRQDNEYMLLNPRWWSADAPDVTGIVSLAHSGGALPSEHHQLPAKHTGVLVVSMGCPVNTCEFCAISRMYDREAKLLTEETKLPRDRLRKLSWYSPENAVRVIEEFVEERPNTQYILFNDNDFASIPEGSLDEFLALYRKRIAKPFYCQSSPHLTLAKGPEFLEKLVASGLDTYCMGIESAANANLTLYRRGGNENFVLRAVELVSDSVAKHGIFMSLDFINGNAAETKTDLRATIELIRSIPLPWDLAIHNLTINDDTVLGKRLAAVAAEYMRSPDRLRIESSDYHHADFENFLPLEEAFYNIVIEWLGGGHDDEDIGRLKRKFEDFRVQEGVPETCTKYPEFNAVVRRFSGTETYAFLLGDDVYALLKTRTDILEYLFDRIRPIRYRYHRLNRYDFDWKFAVAQLLQ